MIKNRLFFLACLLCTLLAAKGIHAGEGKVVSEKKISRVEHVYPISTGFIYVLEDGYSFYDYTKAKKGWKKGDKILVKESYDEFSDGEEYDESSDDDEVFVDVKNLTLKKKSFCARFGWCSPKSKTITNINYERKEGDKIVTFTLSDNSIWQIVYFDETAHAKKWQVGESVLMFVDTHPHSATNPFPLKQDISEYVVEMVNIDNKHCFTGEPAKPIQTK